MKAAKISASLMCADVLDLRRDLAALTGCADYIHCDIMDWHFVPNLMLSPELIARTREACPLPYDFHLMTERPEELIPRLPLRAGDLVSVHAESTVHLQRALAAVRERGATPAAALNPATPLEAVREILPDAGMILLMTVNPGYAGQKLVPQTIDKISRLRRMLDGLGYGDVSVQVDGNCSFENLPRMRAAGADCFVCGSSSLFSAGLTISEAAGRVREAISAGEKSKRPN